METFEKTYKVPSAGLFGGPTEVTIRPMTTKEEKIIYTSKDMSFLEKIVKSCIVKPSDIDLNKLHPNDITFLLYMIREITFGPNYKQKVQCEYCGLRQDIEIDITEMTYRILDLDTLDEKLKVKLPVCGDEITLRLLSQGDFNDIDEHIKRLQRQNSIKDAEGYKYEYRFAKMVKTINGEEKEDIKEVMEYIDNLNMRDFGAIKDALSDIPIGIDTTNVRTCSNCGEEMEVIGAAVPEFFRSN
jgi:hypothetical protein